MYADYCSDSMKEAIEETNRRRKIQQAYNDENGIIPTTIIKPVAPPLHNSETETENFVKNSAKMSRTELQKHISEIEKEMKKAAKAYDFERAAELRDILFEARASLGDKK